MIDVTVVLALVPHALEIGLVLVLGVLLFGNRLPGIARFLGRNMTEFRKGVAEIKEEVRSIDTVAEPKKKDESEDPTKPGSA